MRKLIILLLFGFLAYTGAAQGLSGFNNQFEQEHRAALRRIETALQKSLTKLTAGDSAALPEVASREAQMAYVYIQGYKDFKSALPWVQRSVKRNANSSDQALQHDIAQAYTMMALYYINGWADIPKDADKAFYWCEKAAQKGDAQGMYELGTMYYDGAGVKADVAKAFQWWLSSAMKESPNAYHSVAICYYLGNGVKQDYAQAAKWAKKGIDIKEEYCALLLGVIYYEGQGVARNYAKAFELFNLAARLGEPTAYQAIAECYFYGRGVKRDYVQAKIWCQKGVDANDEEAVEFMKKLKNK